MRSTPHKRVQSLEKSWLAMTNDSRFIPFIQLHEFEAYLLADVSKFGVIFDHSQSGIAKLQEIVDAVSTPELVNDGSQKAPSKRIVNCFPAYAASKRTLGPLVAKLIGLETIRTKCPHFHEWLLQLEQLNDSVPTGAAD